MLTAGEGALELPDPAATAALARMLAPRLRPGETILLSGAMGTGKTTFVRALVDALGGDTGLVASPTFTLLHVYAAPVAICHVDAYRLVGDHALASLGYIDIVDAGAIGAVEWGERVEAELDPGRCWRVCLEHHDPGRRAIVTSPKARGTICN